MATVNDEFVISVARQQLQNQLEQGTALRERSLTWFTGATISVSFLGGLALADSRASADVIVAAVFYGLAFISTAWIVAPVRYAFGVTGTGLKTLSLDAILERFDKQLAHNRKLIQRRSLAFWVSLISSAASLFTLAHELMRGLKIV